MEAFTKESLVLEMRKIRDRGWVPNSRPGNAGGVGNTLEDMLGIEENNLPIPNAAEWELKCQRAGSTSLITLFHMEPSPRAFKFVPNVFLPRYGWPHKEAGRARGASEMSFRQTINAAQRSDRGFGVVVDRQGKKVTVSFDASAVDRRHAEWLASVEQRTGLGEMDPQPYWGFTDLFSKAGSKLVNCFFVQAARKRVGNREYFHSRV